MATVRDLCTNALVNVGLDGLVTDGVPNEEIVDALRHFNNLVEFLPVYLALYIDVSSLLFETYILDRGGEVDKGL